MTYFPIASDETGRIVGTGTGPVSLKRSYHELGAALSTPLYRDSAPGVKAEVQLTEEAGIPTGADHNIQWLRSSPGAKPQASTWRLDDAASPFEFMMTGTSVEFQVTIMNGHSRHTTVWIDDRPYNLETLGVYDAGAEPPTSSTRYLRITLEREATVKVRIRNSGISIRRCRTENRETQLFPAPRKPLIGMVMDSFGSQTEQVMIHEAVPVWVEKTLNANVLVSALGGSGYLKGGSANKPFADPTRVERFAGQPLDLLVFVGSINDDSAVNQDPYREAIRATFDAYAKACPGVPIIAMGLQPTGHARQLNGMLHSNNFIIRDEARQHPAVIGFVDFWGTSRDGTLPPQYEPKSHNAGEKVVWGATVYECVANAAPNASPASTTHWVQKSLVLSGSGRNNSRSNDGSRDIFLANDGVHLTAQGARAFGNTISHAIVDVLMSSDEFRVFNG